MPQLLNRNNTENHSAKGNQIVSGNQNRLNENAMAK